MGRGNLAMFPFDPLPSQWSPNFPLWVWDPFPSPSCPSAGAPLPSHLHFSSPPHSPPHAPCPTWFLGVPPIPWVSMAPHWCLIDALVVRRRKFHVLLVCHLDSAPPRAVQTLRVNLLSFMNFWRCAMKTGRNPFTPEKELGGILVYDFWYQ